ncbi:MAG TPA: HAMP domain-containing sensor histidine kinase [Steroidobacteraceae bacterium]|nr:HAMP domain-containing sensor histidine kinase [Steroidobacteraceae bacterium]
MLHDFLTAHRNDLIARCRSKVLKRRAPKATDAELEHGIPAFLDQLIKTLTLEQSSEPLESRRVSGPSNGGKSASSEIGATAAQHGLELLHHGFTVDQVVHDYGDLCQAVTEMAFEHAVPFQAIEFQTLNRCLDNAIADAVTEFSHARELAVAEKGAHVFNERLGFLGHELRNFVHTAQLAFDAVQRGRVGAVGATGDLVNRSLLGMRALLDRTLADVRAAAAMPVHVELFSVADLISEVDVSASLEAQARNCKLTVVSVDPRLAVDADRALLISAVGNLLSNAFKFTVPHSEVSLRAYGIADRVRIDVEDHCGGLPPAIADSIFLPFTQGSADKSGLGLGLSIAQRMVEANQGTLSVRDHPGSGCVFTIDLPRCAMAV